MPWNQRAGRKSLSSDKVTAIRRALELDDVVEEFNNELSDDDYSSWEDGV